MSHYSPYPNLGLRCRVCDANLEAHRVLELVKCINPKCYEFDRWKTIRPKVKVCRKTDRIAA